MKKDKEKIYTKTALKREYGCTDKMFEYLPEADKIWYGRYKSQRWDAWSQAKVDEFLAKPEVIALLEKKKKQSANRKAAAKKAVETRKKRDLAEFGQVELQKYIYQRTYNKIMEVYPEYKNEIDRQLREHLDRFWGE